MGSLTVTGRVEYNLGQPYVYNKRRLAELEAEELDPNMAGIRRQRFGDVDEPWPQDDTKFHAWLLKRENSITKQRLENKSVSDAAALEEAKRKAQDARDLTIFKIKFFIAIFLVMCIPLAACLTGLHFYGLF